jgi:hypothetical protein
MGPRSWCSCLWGALAPHSYDQQRDRDNEKHAQESSGHVPRHLGKRVGGEEGADHAAPLDLSINVLDTRFSEGREQGVIVGVHVVEHIGVGAGAIDATAGRRSLRCSSGVPVWHMHMLISIRAVCLG